MAVVRFVLRYEDHVRRGDFGQVIDRRRDRMARGSELGVEDI